MSRAGPAADHVVLGALLERVAGRDESGLAELFDAASGWVLGSISRWLADRHSAEEVALDVVVEIWRRGGE